MDREHQFPPSVPIIGPSREVMAGTYGKERELDQQLFLQPLSKALEPLKQRTGVDFYDMYQKSYNLEQKEFDNGKKELVRTSVAGIEDLKPYFVDQRGRTYYRYIERYFDPDKPQKERKDYIIVEEELPQGKILAIFDYGVDPHSFKVEGEIDKFHFRKLIGCYAVVPGNTAEEDQAIDLTSFWSGAARPADFIEEEIRIQREVEAAKIITEKYPEVLFNFKEKIQKRYPEIPPESDEFLLRLIEEMPAEMKDKWNIGLITNEIRVYTIGLVNRREANLTPEEQVELIKQRGYFFFADEQGPEKWLPLITMAAAHSQYEGDITDSFNRSDLPLGAARMLLGMTGQPESELVEQFLKEANRYADEKGTPLRQVLAESTDWIRNRMAVTLYIIKKLHNLGIDLVPKKEYSQLARTIKEKLQQLEELAPEIGGLKPKFV